MFLRCTYRRVSASDLQGGMETGCRGQAVGWVDRSGEVPDRCMVGWSLFCIDKHSGKVTDRIR